MKKEKHAISSHQIRPINKLRELKLQGDEALKLLTYVDFYLRRFSALVESERRMFLKFPSKHTIEQLNYYQAGKSVLDGMMKQLQQHLGLEIGE